ncbi:murein biosynthesis integral membrane protein MurJ [Jonquetella anthropi]|uniref:murein biosynthesis integral membrane protein MurJ n=1 Tax=Jonquetella anthropi TaxID=428712 RepID=UPI0002E5949F|nr:lipid II flippase MurJ [Jonquetella anthropi]
MRRFFRSFWNSLMGRQTARGAALVSITFTGLGKVLGYGRTLLIAWLFGASGGVDAFYVALGILSLLVTTASTVLTSTLLPVMANASPEVGRAFFVRIWRIFMGGTIVLLLGISLFPGSVVEFFARNFDPQRMHQAAIMLLWMIPWTVGMIHQSFLTVWSNLQGRYSVVSSILNIWNVVAIAFMWGAGKYWGEVAIAQAYSLSIVLVTILMWFVLADMPMSAQQGSIPKGLRRQFWTEVLICLGIVGSSGLFQVVDRYFGSALPEGNIAALGYASVVYTLPIQVLGPIFYVFLVKSSKAKTLTESQGQLQSALLLIWGYLFPCGCVLAVASKPVVSILFGHGAFGADAIALTAKCISMASPIIPFAAWQGLLFRYAQAQHRLMLIMVISYVGVVLNGFLDWLFLPFWGAPGLCLATSLVWGAVSLSYLLILSRELLVPVIKQVSFSSCIVLAIATGFSLIGTLASPFPYLLFAGTVTVAYFFLGDCLGMFPFLPSQWRPLAMFGFIHNRLFNKSLKSS